MGLTNVINIYENGVYQDIQSFLNEMEMFNEKTSTTYERGIRDFFQIVKEKELEFVNSNDLNLEKNDVEYFRQVLKKQGYSNLTINNKVTSLRRLLVNLKVIKNEFKQKKYDIDTDFFDAIKRLPENAESYDAFTVEEVLNLAELALEEKHNGLIKSLYIQFALDTCIRKEAILKLKWTNFHATESDEVQIVGFDKYEKEYRKVINKAFYNELLKIKTNSENVFDINVRSIDVMMPRLIKKLNLNTDRKLAFHSIRKTGVTFIFRLTGDLKAAQKAANHKKASLTIETYVEEQDYGIQGAISMKYVNNQDILNNLTFEQYRVLINNLNTDTKLILTQKAKELFV